MKFQASQKRRTIAAVAALAGVATLAACSSSASTSSAPSAAGGGSAPASAPSSIKIGTLYASSGSFATSSKSQYDGLKFWASQVNAKGGVEVAAYKKKIPVKIVSYNDQSQTSTAATQYNQLITQNKVNVLVADFGSVLTSVAVPIAQEHNMVLFDPTGTGGSLFSASNKDIVLTSLPTSAIWPTSLVNYLIASKIKKVAVLYDANDFTASQASTVKKKLNAVGTKPVYYKSIPTTTSSYSSLIHAIKATNPDAVLEFGYDTNDIAFLKNLQSSGTHFNMVFTVFPGQELSLLKKNVGVKGLAYTYTYPTPPILKYQSVNYGMNISDFSSAFKSADGSSPDFLNAAGYNSGLIIQDTLEHAKSLSQADLRAAAASVSGKVKTLDGSYKINSQGAQTGETLPVAQFVPSGSDLKVNVVFPKNIATAKAIYPAP